ncbi:MAG: 7-carboxy-7-deazaguanine synthase QueE [Pyrinomonadaceae bacterium]
MRCVWCDSEYTFTGGQYVAVEEVMNQVRMFACNLVEVTGGEPLAQREAFTLINRLCSEGYEVLVETGGYISTVDVDSRAKIILDVKCPSSGEHGRNHWPNLERLRPEKDEAKFVVANMEDWNYARDVIKDYRLEQRVKAVLVSPAWGKIDLKDLADWISSSGLDVRMQLQLHKYVWGPEARGV